MLNFKKIYDEINEDAVMAPSAGDAVGGDVSPSTPSTDADIVSRGTSTEDVLGKDCDHHKDGYLGPGCFHVPSRVCKMSKREILSGKKKKNQKNIYAKGLKVIEEAELNKRTILAIHNVKELELRNYILHVFGDGITDAMYVQAIAYFPITKTFFVKVIDAGEDNKSNLTKYVNLDFKRNKFITTDDLSIYNTKEIRQKYSDLHGMKCWIVWGGI